MNIIERELKLNRKRQAIDCLLIIVAIVFSGLSFFVNASTPVPISLFCSGMITASSIISLADTLQQRDFLKELEAVEKTIRMTKKVESDIKK